MSRKLYEIAKEIFKDWRKPFGKQFLCNVHPSARPYLDAMRGLETMADMYSHDSARSIVRYFLANASSWRGETARRIKKELNDMLDAG